MDLRSNPNGKAWSPKKLDVFEVEDFVGIPYDVSISFPRGESGGGIDDDVVVGKLHAHKFVLERRSPQLYEMVKEDGTIEISDTSPLVIKALLVHAYTGAIKIKTLPQIDSGSSKIDLESTKFFKILPPWMQLKSESKIDLEFTKDFLLASDKYANIHLKLSLQSMIIDRAFNKDNIAELLLIAHNHNCALLKESCIELITEFSDEIMATAGWSAVLESKTLTNEIFKAMSSKLKDPKKEKKSLLEFGFYDVHDPESYSVGQLLAELERRGLDLDGTKKMLADRLTESNASYDNNEAAATLRDYDNNEAAAI